jgi:hypothetical protein
LYKDENWECSYLPLGRNWVTRSNSREDENTTCIWKKSLAEIIDRLQLIII